MEATISVSARQQPTLFQLPPVFRVSRWVTVTQAAAARLWRVGATGALSDPPSLMTATMMIILVTETVTVTVNLTSLFKLTVPL